MESPKYQRDQDVIYKGLTFKVLSLYRKTLEFKNMGWFYTLDCPNLKPVPEDQLKEFSYFRDAPKFFTED